MPKKPSLADANVRSQTYYVASTRVRCSHCGLPTRLLALAMPPGHETLDTDSDADGGGEPNSDAWQAATTNAFLFHVAQLSEDVRDRLNRISQSFRLAQGANASHSYWANYCEHCGTQLGDYELHCEPDGAFCPSNEAAAAGIELEQVQAPFEAVTAGYAFEPEFFPFMRRG
jgi:hypothetical protein